jgi:hypothetical protein
VLSHTEGFACGCSPIGRGVPANFVDLAAMGSPTDACRHFGEYRNSVFPAPQTGDFRNLSFAGVTTLIDGILFKPAAPGYCHPVNFVRDGG